MGRLRACLLPVVLAVLLAAASMPAPADAQDGADAPPPVLTIDQERLFAESEVAKRIGDEIEAQAAALAAENRHIEAELSAEELELTEKRPTLPVEEFRALADAFDAKVQRIRDEQDAKERDLQSLREAGRQDFLRSVTPVLTEIARERGALVILDRRTVVLSAGAVDATDEAIARVDEALAEEAPPEETPSEESPSEETPAPPAPDMPEADGAQ